MMTRPLHPARFVLLFASLASGNLLAAPLQFPDIEGRTLTKEAFSVPASLTQPLNLIVVAFKQEQQALVDTWIPAMVALETKRDDFAFYEFPTMSPMIAPVRWFIANGMRSGIKEEDARRRTVSFHLEKEPFRNALEIPHEDDIFTFLVDAGGTVLWRTTGVYDAAKAEALAQALRAAAPGEAGADAVE